MKVQFLLPTNQWLTTEIDKRFAILPNFEAQEIANTSAKEDIKLVVDERAWKLLTMLQLTRNRFGRMAVSSVYRTKTFNASIPNADPKSCHLKCWAFDWPCANQTATDRTEKTEWWQSLCKAFGEIGAINLYSNGYHMEIGSDIQYGNTQFVVRDYRGKKGDW